MFFFLSNTPDTTSEPRGESYIKGRGCVSEMFKRTLKRSGFLDVA